MVSKICVRSCSESRACKYLQSTSAVPGPNTRVLIWRLHTRKFHFIAAKVAELEKHRYFEGEVGMQWHPCRRD
eukprot:6197209-Pleurochrysis_carterae.AAC.2